MKAITQFFILITLLFAITTPVYAADPQIPPIPEWPVIGPVLRWLGIVKPEPEIPVPEAVIVEPLRDIPEYAIESMDDVQALEKVETETSVRISIREETLNTLLAEKLGDITGLNSATITLEEEQISINVQIDRDILDTADFDIPLVRGDTLNVTVQGSLIAQDCRIVTDLEKLKVNRLGLTILFRQQINTLIEENWPDEVCLESVTLKEDEIVAEGYRQ